MISRKEAPPKQMAPAEDRSLEIQSLHERIQELEQMLDSKISESAQMQNMKKMLMSKNEKLKEYKTRLSKYEPVE